MRDQPNASFDRRGPSDHPLDEQLAEYAAALASGHATTEGFATLTAHLAECAECQVEIDDLLELLEPIFADGDLEISPATLADRSFLEVKVNQVTAPEQDWLLDAGRLLVFFSDALLRRANAPAFAGRARGQLLYRYTQEPGSVDDLEVAIEVYAEDATVHEGRVRVSVDVPSRGPLDQTGSTVILHAGDAQWQGETDESGQIDFAPVPLAALPQMRVEIAPLQEL
jgi:hypothetical protein